MNTFRQRKRATARNINKKEDNNDNPMSGTPSNESKPVAKKEKPTSMSFNDDSDGDTVDLKNAPIGIKSRFGNRVIQKKPKSGLVVEAPKREITAEELHRTIRMDENAEQKQDEPMDGTTSNINMKNIVNDIFHHPPENSNNHVHHKHEITKESILQDTQDYYNVPTMHSMEENVRFSRYDELSSDSQDSYDSDVEMNGDYKKGSEYPTTVFVEETKSTNVAPRQEVSVLNVDPEEMYRSASDTDSDSEGPSKNGLSQFERDMIKRGLGYRTIHTSTPLQASTKKMIEEADVQLPSYDKLMNELMRTKNNLARVYNERQRGIVRLEQEIQYLKESNNNFGHDVHPTHDQLDYYTDLFKYIKSTSHCYTQKRPTINEAYQSLMSLQKQYRAANDLYIRLFHEDDFLCLKQRKSLVGRDATPYKPPSSSDLPTLVGPYKESEIFYELEVGQQVRYQQREQLLTPLYRYMDEKTNMLTISIEDFVLLIENVYADRSNYSQIYRQEAEERLTTIETTFEDIQDLYSSCEQILSQFKTFRNLYEKQYTEIFASESLPSLLEFLIKSDLIHWDPLMVLSEELACDSFQQLPFFVCIDDYMKDSKVDSDYSILKNVIQSFLIPYLSNYMETMWNVYHYSQSEKIFALFKQLLEVTRDNYIITPLIDIVYKRFQSVLESSSFYTVKCSTPQDQEILERHILLYTQVIRGILLFKIYIGQEHAFEMISVLIKKMWNVLKYYLQNPMYKVRVQMICNYILSVFPTDYFSYTNIPCNLNMIQSLQRSSMDV